MAPYRNDCGEKNLSLTVYDKKWQFIKKLLAKNGSKTVEKNMAPYKNHSGENKLNQTV